MTEVTDHLRNCPPADQRISTLALFFIPGRKLHECHLLYTAYDKKEPKHIVKTLNISCFVLISQVALLRVS